MTKQTNRKPGATAAASAIAPDAYTRITSRIVADLEQGVRPWCKPWGGDQLGARITRPRRANGKPYSGILPSCDRGASGGSGRRHHGDQKLAWARQPRHDKPLCAGGPGDQAKSARAPRRILQYQPAAAMEARRECALLARLAVMTNEIM